MKSCRQFRARFYDAVEGTLPIEDLLALEAHVRACRSCGAIHARIRRLEESFTRLAEPPIGGLDLERQVAVVRQRIERDAAPPTPKLTAVPRIGVAVSAAAAAILVWFAWRGSEESRGPDGVPVADAVLLQGTTAGSANGAALELAAGSVPTSDPAALEAGAGTEEPRTEARELLAGEPAALPSGDSLVDQARPAPEIHPADVARLETARATIRESLAEAASLLPADPLAFLESVDQRLRDLAAEEWPVTRIVEGFAGDKDPRVARASLRFLGRRGDALSLPAIEAGLRRPELEREACLALIDAGERGVRALQGVVLDDEIGGLALDALRARGSRAASRALDETLRRNARGATPESVQRTLDALVGLGPLGLERALALADDGVVTVPALSRSVAAAPRGSKDLAAILEKRPRQVPDAIALALVRDAGAEDALPWVEELVIDASQRSDHAGCDAALGAITSLASPAALTALVRLHASGRMSAAWLEPAIVRFLERAPTAVESLLMSWSRERRMDDLRHLHGILCSTVSRAVIVPLVLLVKTGLAPASDRRYAILYAGEQALPTDVDLFAALFRELPREQPECRAACLMVVQRLGGRKSIASVLSGAPERTRLRVHDLLDAVESKSRPMTTMTRIARELEAVIVQL